ncbi:MAG: hypothetical protein AAB263_17230 [Planctomycetota bacterium]
MSEIARLQRMNSGKGFRAYWGCQSAPPVQGHPAPFILLGETDELRKF